MSPALTPTPTGGRRTVAALLLALLAACELPPAPGNPYPPPIPGAVAFTPPPEFQHWWLMVQKCANFARNVHTVGWYVLPGSETLPSGASGTYYRATGQILLAAEAVDSAIMVRHEMLHAVLPVGGHPRAYFLGSCQGIVNCRPECVTAAGGIHDPPETAPEILPAELTTTITISPLEPLESFADGSVAVILSVTNPHPHAVWVRLTPETPEGTRSATFGIQIDSGGSGLPFAARGLTIDGTRFGLGPKETRRFVLDDKVRAGPFGVRAWFNADTLERRVYQAVK